jgi:hypothetical protein
MLRILSSPSLPEKMESEDEAKNLKEIENN